MRGRVLIIAGSDPSGGAGIQGDIKTVTSLGGYAAAAVTALTAQNTLGVFGVYPVPGAFVAQQAMLVLEDIGADAIKTGMLHSAEVIEAVLNVLEKYPSIPLIVDPVMVSTSGVPLLQSDAMELLITKLLPRAALLTPNALEAELILGSGSRVAGREDMEIVGKEILALGCKAVLMKGGHLEGEQVTDVLLATRYPLPATYMFSSPRLNTPHTHGTGCTLASAIATGIAQGMELDAAVERAHDYVYEAIRTAPHFGKGQGPLNHLHTFIDS